MKLEEIEKICNEATPGPWEVAGESGASQGVDQRINFSIQCKYVDAWKAMDTDPRFVRMARTELPKLLAVAKAAGKYLVKEDCVDFASFDYGDYLGSLEDFRDAFREFMEKE